MWNCHDERIKYLSKFGYNVISLPRMGIRPLTVALLKDKRQLIELGSLPEIWSSKAEVPVAKTEQDVAKIGGQSTGELNTNVGLDILSNLVQALGMDPIKVKAQYQKATTFQFHFKDVERERITAFSLGKYLISGEMASSDPFVKRYFQPSEKVYVVTEVLKSPGFGVTATDASKTGLDVKIPLIKEAISGEGKVEVSSARQGTVEFSGQTKLPFAFVAAQMDWSETEKHWSVIDFPDPGEIHLGTSEPPPGDASSLAQHWKGAILFGNGVVDLEKPTQGS